MRLTNRTKRLLLGLGIVSFALVGSLCIGLIKEIKGVIIGCPFLVIAVLISIYTFLYPVIDKPQSLQDKIDVMNLTKYKNKFNFGNCSLCLNNKQYMVLLDCSHYFCNDCIFKSNMEKCQDCKRYIDPFAVSYFINEV
jgi:hypothetical protein